MKTTKITHTWGGTLHLKHGSVEAWPKSEYTLEAELEPGDDEALVMEMLHSSAAASVRVDLKRAAGALLRDPQAEALANAAQDVIANWETGGSCVGAVSAMADVLADCRKAWG